MRFLHQCIHALTMPTGDFNVGKLSRPLQLTCGLLLLSQTSIAETPTAEGLLPNDAGNFGSAIFLDNFMGSPEEVRMAQTFTAEVAGTISSIELSLWYEFPAGGSPTAPISIELWGVTPAGLPDSTDVRATSSVSIADISQEAFTLDFSVVDFSHTSVSVAVGDQLAIVARSTTDGFPDWYLWTARLLSDNIYPGGQFFFGGDPTWFSNPGEDTGFRVNVAGETSSYCVAAANSASAGATISSTGSTSLAANDFTLMTIGLPPSVSGLYFYGPTQIQTPFGDGFRCVGGIVQRLQPPIIVDGAGQAILHVDFTMPPANSGAGAIVPFSNWNFQLWYRDPTGPGGNGYNASDGLRATFCP